MSWKSERRPLPAARRGWPVVLRLFAVLAVALCCAWLGSAPVAQAQSGTGNNEARAQPTDNSSEGWDKRAQEIGSLLAAPTTTVEELQAAREALVQARNQAIDAQTAGQTKLKELEARIAALGPKPQEGAEEPAEIAGRRLALEKQLGDARVPVVQAQEAEARANQLVADLDRRLLEEFSQSLVNRGPSPVFQSNWLDAFTEVTEEIRVRVAELISAVAAVDVRATFQTDLPLQAIFLLGAVALTFMVRNWLSDWIEMSLEQATRPRTVAWILALRNLNRIILPTVAAGLIFSYRSDGDAAVGGGFQYFGVPEFVWYLIGASWLMGSLFAPRSASYRILPLDNAEARTGARITFYLGMLLSCDALLSDLTAAGGLSVASQAVLYFPLLCVGAYQLYLVSTLLRLLRRRINDRVAAEQTDAQSLGIGLQMMDLSVRLLRVAAVLAPILAALGFLAAARLLEFPVMQTLGLIGAALVIFDLLSKTAVSLLSAPRKAARDGEPREGLIPVFVAILVVIACLPVLGLIWGARTTDISEAWRLMREGVSVGGVTVSLVAVVWFILTFAMVIAVARLVQTLLRGTVLPRTRLDAGGRNAVIAGVNYIGFTIAALLAISAAGLDLTNIAIVAGALSVGIGFGLQTIVSNFVSGIILLIERPIKEGDWIEVGEFSGYVSGIRVRSTEIETFDKATVIVPNADLVAGTVLNRTHSDIAGRLIVPVHVSYDTDPRKVEEVLMDIVERHPLVLEDPPPVALFIGFGPDALNFELRCYLRDVNFLLTVRSDMNFEIADRFRKEGIHIPVPQRDLHIRSVDGLGEALKSAAAGDRAFRPEVVDGTSREA